MKIIKKTLNKLIGYLIKVLSKIYKPEKENQQAVVKTDLGNVLVNFPKEGGMQSWIPGHDFPFPGVPDNKIVETISIIKKMFPIIYKWAWVTMRDRLPQYLIPQSQDGAIGLVDPMKYSKPVRELHRAFTSIRAKEGEKEMQAKWTEMRDILCLFFEYDDAYRFRLMETIQELDKSQFEFDENDAYWAGWKWRYFFNDQKIKEKREKYSIPWTNVEEEKIRNNKKNDNQ
jgi:hypothetical protein